MRRKKIETPVLLLNGIGTALLIYYGWMYLSQSTHITNPEAMLVMEDWEAAGILLTAGTVPLFIANFGAYLYLWRDTVTGPARLLFFLPCLIAFVLAVHYWTGGMRESNRGETKGAALKTECLYAERPESDLLHYWTMK